MTIMAFSLCSSAALARVASIRRRWLEAWRLSEIVRVSYGPAPIMSRRIRHIPRIRPTMPIVCSIIVALPHPWARLFEIWKRKTREHGFTGSFGVVRGLT